LFKFKISGGILRQMTMLRMGKSTANSGLLNEVCR